MKKLSVKITKTNKKTLNDNKRNYFNCVSDYNYCFTNSCRSEHCNVNRREWNTYTSTKSKE